MPETNDEKEISIVEAALMLLVVVPADIIDFFVPSDFWILDVPITAIMTFWFLIKGARWEWELAGNLIEFIPIVDTLPIRTAMLIVAIYLTNHPPAAVGGGAPPGSQPKK